MAGSPTQQRPSHCSLKTHSVIGVNGAAAHLVNIDDRLIICTYADLDPSEWETHKPTVLFFDAENNFKIKAEKNRHQSIEQLLI